MGLENPTHWIPIIVVLLLVFGAKRLPEIGRSLGSGLREFKHSISSEPAQPNLTAGPPSQQAPDPSAPAQTAPQAQDAFAQREPATSDRG